jgi:hypothetical protein
MRYIRFALLLYRIERAIAIEIHRKRLERAVAGALVTE